MHAKLLQLCPTLCNTMDSSPPGSSSPRDSLGKNTGVGCHFLLHQWHWIRINKCLIVFIFANQSKKKRSHCFLNCLLVRLNVLKICTSYLWIACLYLFFKFLFSYWFFCNSLSFMYINPHVMKITKYLSVCICIRWFVGSSGPIHIAAMNIFPLFPWMRK